MSTHIRNNPQTLRFDAGIVYSLGVYVYIYSRRLYTRKLGMSLCIRHEVFQRMWRLCWLKETLTHTHGAHTHGALEGKGKASPAVSGCTEMVFARMRRAYLVERDSDTHIWCTWQEEQLLWLFLDIKTWYLGGCDAQNSWKRLWHTHMVYLTGRALFQLFLAEALRTPTCLLLLRCVGVCRCLGRGGC